MEYTSTVIISGHVDDNDTKYPDKTVTNTLRLALQRGYTLTADALTGKISLVGPDRTIVITPAEKLPTPTRAQRREVLALAASHGPITWAYGSSNVIQLRDGERLIKHAMTMSLLNGGYLGERTGKGNPANLSLLAYLVLGAGQKDTYADQRLAQALTRMYGPKGGGS
ncbi:hypothetical protein ACH427_04540 [Streptomyces sp. NPDC020379]|uniref:hypothetical protein n=1 Tax=Streptomyces sp. NPDC020379 TaxID=3365071 RepID=UPI0037A2C9A0